MKGKKLLAGVLSAAMVLGTMAFPAFADGGTSMSFDEFVAKIEAGQNVGTDSERLTIEWSPVSGCRDNRGASGHTCIAENVPATALTPMRVNSSLAQFHVANANTNNDVVIKNVDFKYTAADFNTCLNSGWKGSFTKEQAPTAQIYLLNNGNVTVSGCTFDNAVLTMRADNVTDKENRKVSVEDCTFKNISNSYGLKDVQAGNVVIAGNTFENTRSGIMLSGATAENVLIDNNTFSCDDSLGGDLIQIASNFAFDSDSSVAIVNNTSTSNTPVLRALNDAMTNLIYANNTIPATAPLLKDDASDAMKNAINDKLVAPVAQIGDKYYTSLKDAMQAACNMNVEDVNGVPTQTAPVTIDLVSDIENQEGFFVRGGDRGGKRNNEYGGHYNHDINIILDGHEHKIDTGKTGSVLDSNSATKIGFASINGKFTVKNVIAPNDLVFDLSRTYNDNVSDCRGDVGQADSLTVENCTFYGSNAAYCGAVDYVTYKNNKFLLTENANNGPDSYPLWYKFNNHIKSFTFEGNTVKSQRALNLARFAENSEIVVNNNSFTIANTENPAKSAAIMLAENHTASSPFSGNVIFSGNTVDAHSAVLVFAPSEYNTSFNLTAESNILANGTKLVGYNEWSGTYNDQAAKEAAETLVKKVETNANDGANVADTLKLTFKNHDDDERVYDIVLNGDGKDINRLNAAEFEFELSNAAMTYEVKAADKLTTLQPDVKKYVFYFDGKDAINNADTGSEITIGTVTFDGFGVFTFKAIAGKATATTTADNLVTEFVTTGEAGKGALKIGEDDNMIKDAEIKVPTQKLTVNVAMEHNVGDNTEAYQDMTVAISGGDLAGKVLEYKLGDAANTAITKAMNGTMVASYQIKADLTKDRIYTVTVSGAGYRTSRYTVTMTEDKTMNFWNNDKTNEVTVIDDEKAKTTFLAGELVRDGKIDIYDLSAVVAYFGQKNIDKTQASKFAKYDLNRDGEIDIMDISIVLTSWGK